MTLAASDGHAAVDGDRLGLGERFEVLGLWRKLDLEGSLELRTDTSGQRKQHNMTITHGPITPSRGHDAVPPSDDWVPRFGVTERLTHWWTMLMIATALVTGAGLGDDGGGPLLIAHVLAVALIGVGLVVAVLVGDRRALLRAALRLFRFDRRDVAWLHARLRHPFSRGIHREWGMFNTGQKFLAWALSISIAVVIVTGIQSWSAGGEGGNHDTAIVVSMVLLGTHVFMAVVNPATRPALAGMVVGRVRRSWAATHHAAWLKDNDR